MPNVSNIRLPDLNGHFSGCEMEFRERVRSQIGIWERVFELYPEAA